MVKRRKKKNVFLKEILNSIKANIKKFLSLVCIIILGVGFFVGMKTSSPDMKQTVSKMYQKNKFMDIKIISATGFDDKELESLKKQVNEIKSVEGSYQLDTITELKGAQVVVIVHSYNNSKKLNKLNLIEGRLPSGVNECIVEKQIMDLGYKLGDTIDLNNDNFKNPIVTIVGVVQSPLYISTDKGNTSLLSGKIDFYMYVNETNFKLETYNVAYVELKEQFDTFKLKYQNYTIKVKNQIKKVSKKLSQEYLSNDINEYKTKINDMETQYNNKYSEAEKQLADAESQISSAESQINAGYSQVKTDAEINAYLNNIKQQLDSAKSQLDTSKQKIDSAKKEYDKTITEASSKSEVLIAGLQQQKNIYNAQITVKKQQLQVQINSLKYWENLRDKAWFQTTKKRYQTTIDGINVQIKNLETEISNLNSKVDQVDNQIAQVRSQASATAYPAEIVQAEQQYNFKYNEYINGLNQYNIAKSDLKKQNNSLKSSLDSKKTLLETKKQELEVEKEKGKKQLDELKLQIEDAKDKLSLLENSDWYLFTRSDNSGYSQYSDDVQRISNLGKIFPIIFFLVAALMTLTSISRMIEEDRTQIGTFKALGYKNYKILSKYLLYAFFSAMIGSIIGIIIGSTLLPIIFYRVYNLMYNLPPLKLQFNIFYSSLGVLIALLSTVVTAYIVCRSTLKETPAKLMKCKTEKSGKRTLLEHISFIWKRFSFNKKITYRNLFRYKKRFIMTVIGVAGCMSLIISGFALRNAISSIVPTQYVKLFSMDVQLYFKDDVDRASIAKETERIESLEEVTGTSLAHQENISISNGSKTYRIFLISPENNKKFNKMVKLRNEKSGENYTLSDNGIILSSKLANLLNKKEGDYLTYTDNNGIEYKAVIEHITENYVSHYMYISPLYFEKIMGHTPKNNMLLVDTKGSYDKSELSKKFNEGDKISSMTFLSLAMDFYKEIMKNLNLVVLVIIIAAGLLAFMVLYNLSSINISERKSELATIKVLGFRKKEVDLYIKKEMRVLTYIGVLLGLFVSRYLSEIIIRTCEVDNLMFNHKLRMSSYIISVIITLTFSYLVDIITKRELSKIDMIGSLKINE